MQHEDYKELVALDAAGALEEGERAALEEHLSSCEECRAELSALSDTAAALAYTVAPVAPPRHLRASILESVRALDASTQTAAARTMPAADGPNVVSDGMKIAGDGPSVVGGDDSEGRRASVALEDLRAILSRFSLWQLLGARPSLAFGGAAAALAVVVLCVSTFTLWGQTQTLRSEIDKLNARLDASERELAGERVELARARDVSDVLAGPEARVARLAGDAAPLAGKSPAPAARALVAYDRASGRAVIIASGLPPAPEGKAYQLWFIAGGKPLPGGTFKTDPAGRARMSDKLPSSAADPSAFAVTLEREGGETAPKGEMYLLSAAS